ncbi:MAG: glycosyltransferase [Planctomycetota bacterium]|nr:MAG: glycosyltransferase [Planctomycetota bacterium]
MRAAGRGRRSARRATSCCCGSAIAASCGCTVRRNDAAARAVRRRGRGFARAAHGVLSIIVVTRDEAAALGRCLDELARVARDRGPGALEIVVSDGGSRDGTRAVVAARPGVRWIEGAAGRGAQLDRGVRAARGDRLWFLHADSVPPPGALDAIEAVLRRPEVALGAFRFRLDAAGWVYRVIEWGVRLRSERLGLPYGDQGLFCRREIHERTGGFGDRRIMEDVAFVRAARRHGAVCTLPLPLTTSARRWQRHGLVRTTLRNWLLLAAGAVGAGEPTLQRLARAFARRDGRERTR